MVRRTPNTNVLELTVSGREGDEFTYAVTRRDGSVVHGTSERFGPGQTDAILTTGVPHADIASVTVSATGAVGVAGTRVISTIR